MIMVQKKQRVPFGFHSSAVSIVGAIFDKISGAKYGKSRRQVRFHRLTTSHDADAGSNAEINSAWG